MLTRVPGGEIIYDVKCTRNLAGWIKDRGGKPTMWNTGHALVKAKLKETGAPLAGEMSGHVFFKERWYGFDDGLYTGARLLEILSRHVDANPVLKGLPNATSTPELNIKMNEGEPFALVDKLKAEAQFNGAESILTIDGVRVEYADGFGLARPSNTTPVRRAALRSRQRNRHRAYPGRFPTGHRRGLAGRQTALLSLPQGASRFVARPKSMENCVPPSAFREKNVRLRSGNACSPPQSGTPPHVVPRLDGGAAMKAVPTFQSASFSASQFRTRLSIAVVLLNLMVIGLTFQSLKLGLEQSRARRHR